MRKKFLIPWGILCVGLLHAQVGINTKNPQGVFHVDSKGNTTGTIAAPINDSDDVIVTSSGKVGIGTIAPNTLLEIKTAGTAGTPVPGFQLQDGNQSNGYVLVSDASGIATWKNVAPNDVAQLIVPSNAGVAVNFNDANYYNTKSYIILPPGKWSLNSISLIRGAGTTIKTPVWISSTLGDASTIANSGGTLAAIKSPDIEGTGLVSGICWSAAYMTITGSFVVNNTSSVNKTYYYVVGGCSSFGVTVTGGYFNNVGGLGWGELNLIAYRIPSGL